MFLRSRSLAKVAASLAAAVLILFLVGGADKPTKKETASYRGRWDLVVEGAQGNYPSWLEVRQSGRTLVGSFVGEFGKGPAGLPHRRRRPHPLHSAASV